MPHSHSNPKAVTRRIEDMIEQLLRRGQEISSTLKAEMNYVSRQHRVPCSRSTSRATEVSCSKMTVVSSCSQKSSSKKEKKVQTSSRLSPSSSKKSQSRGKSLSSSQKKLVYTIPKTRKTSSEKSLSSSRSDAIRSRVKTPVFTDGQEKGESVNPTSSKEKTIQSSPKEELVAKSVSSVYYFEKFELPEVKKVGSRYYFEESSEFVDKPMKEASQPKKKQSKVCSPGKSCSQKSRSKYRPICRPVKIPRQSCFPQPKTPSETKIDMTVEPVFKEKSDDWTRIYQNKTINGSDEILTRVYSPSDPNSKWIRVNEVWTSQQGGPILNLWLDLLGEKYKNVWVNGKQIDI